MKHAKCMAALLAVLLFCSPPAAQAGFFDGGAVLHPGDHVFDLKRFMDSVKETAEALEIVKNSLDNLKNRILARVGLDDDGKVIAFSIEHSGGLSEDSPVHPAHENKPFQEMDQETWKLAKEGQDYLSRIQTTLDKANADTAAFMQRIFGNIQEREQADIEILHLDTQGILGEKQRENNQQILHAVESSDRAQVTGTQYMDRVAQQEAETMKNRLDQQKIKAEEVYGYDPYHPTDYDLQHRQVKSENLGFMKFGE